jgi:hypothetical protein
MVVELVIFGGKDEEKAVQELREIVSGGQDSASHAGRASAVGRNSPFRPSGSKGPRPER